MNDLQAAYKILRLEPGASLSEVEEAFQDATQHRFRGAWHQGHGKSQSLLSQFRLELTEGYPGFNYGHPISPVHHNDPLHSGKVHNNCFS